MNPEKKKHILSAGTFTLSIRTHLSGKVLQNMNYVFKKKIKKISDGIFMTLIYEIASAIEYLCYSVYM